MSSTKSSDGDVDDVNDMNITLMTLKKPTELQRVIDSVPKPTRAVPKNGLPIWYRMGLECKLPVPNLPKGKIVFSRGKLGEDVRRLGIGNGPRPTFDLTDPYCYNIYYDYVPLHDSSLTHYFAQKPARNRMKKMGLCTPDNRAVCTLKEFNEFRKYLYNQLMDRIHTEIAHLDERARDDLALKRVEVDVNRRRLVFRKAERAREHLEKVAREHADEFEMKKREAKEQEKKAQARLKYLAEFKEKQRQESAARARETENRIKQRVQASAELELRRKVTMVRQWRVNERKRINRLKHEREAKRKRLEEETDRKWAARVSAQNAKIQEEALLLRIYSEDMKAAAARRSKKAEIYAYVTDLSLQRIRLANLKMMHGGSAKAAQLVRKMGCEFEKSKRGAKGMSLELANKLAVEAMKSAISTEGDRLMTLGQARVAMDIQTVLPTAPIKILEEMLETVIIEFARRHVNILLQDLERVVHARAAVVFFQNFRPSSSKKKVKKQPRWSTQVKMELTQGLAKAKGHEIIFGEIAHIPADTFTDIEMKSVKNRPPTPVPSKTKLAEVTFMDRIEDLPDPVSLPNNLPERRKLLEMVNIAAKILSRSVSQRVEKGLDIVVGQVTLPNMRHPMEWGEAVETLACAVVDNRVQSNNADVRRASEFLSHRILCKLNREMKEEKNQKKLSITSEDNKDFYVPEESQSVVSDQL